MQTKWMWQPIITRHPNIKQSPLNFTDAWEEKENLYATKAETNYNDFSKSACEV